jgi:hypothetical protein
MTVAGLAGCVFTTPAEGLPRAFPHSHGSRRWASMDAADPGRWKPGAAATGIRVAHHIGAEQGHTPHSHGSRRWAFIHAVFAVGLVAGIAASVAQADVTLDRRDGRIDVAIDVQPFTSYVFAGQRKPILFPLLAPGGRPLTRSWPVVDGVVGEPHDHPHHESVWFMHGRVNDVDFWASHPKATNPSHRNDDRVEQTELVRCEGGDRGVIETTNRWVTAKGDVVCTDSRRLVFAAAGGARTIDFTITIHAAHGPVTFGDTKEGTMALRVHPALQPKDAHGSRGAAGTVVNSEGLRNAEAWGKPARWVDYSGPIDGQTVGVAMLDHPRNLRHPTRWHARDYGLCAANPFGLHDFAGAAAGAGDHTIPAGESLTLRYLIVCLEGDAAAAGIEDLWRRWAGAAETGRP